MLVQEWLRLRKGFGCWFTNERTKQPAGKVRGQLINFVSWLITDKPCADMGTDKQSGYA